MVYVAGKNQHVADIELSWNRLLLLGHALRTPFMRARNYQCCAVLVSGRRGREEAAHHDVLRVVLWMVITEGRISYLPFKWEGLPEVITCRPYEGPGPAILDEFESQQLTK